MVEGVNHMFQHCQTGMTTEYRDMEKTIFSRTDISEDVLLQLTKTSELIKRLNSLSLVNHIQKHE